MFIQTPEPSDIAADGRYTRLEMIKTLNFEKIRHAKVMVIGAGAVGNEVIKNLALFGVGNIYIVDFDNIEKSNLTRAVLFRERDTKKKSYKSIVAAKRANEINPDCNIIARNADIVYDIGLGVFRQMDAVICCIDSRFGRLMINRYCYWLNKSWINCGILDAEGICTVYKPGVNDYESELSDFAWKNIRFRLGCPDIARTFFEEGSTPTTPISASIIGAVQVSEALKIIHGYDEQLLAGFEFRFDLRKNEFFLTEGTEIKADSESHKRMEYIQMTNLSSASTISQLKDYIARETDNINYEVVLRNPVVTKVQREIDGKTFKTLVKESGLAQYLDKKKMRDCDSDHLHNRIFIKEKTTVLTAQTPLDKFSLKSIGVPDLDILEVRTETKGTLYIELTADSSKYFNQSYD